MGRIAIESRSGQQTWDLINTPTANQLPDAVMLQFDPPEANNIMASARDPNRRWYGVYANYNSPAYNTNLVKKEELPKTYEEFLAKKEWVGKVAIEGTDNEWMNAMFAHYGDAKGRKLLEDMLWLARFDAAAEPKGAEPVDLAEPLRAAGLEHFYWFHFNREGPPEAEFHMARLAYATAGCAGSRGFCNPWWAIDYPEAEAHFLPAVLRMTRTEVAAATAAGAVGRGCAAIARRGPLGRRGRSETHSRPSSSGPPASPARRSNISVAL